MHGEALKHPAISMYGAARCIAGLDPNEFIALIERRKLE